MVYRFGMAKRRTAGEGTIRRRADGRWEARLSYADQTTGEHKRRSFFGRTQREAREKMNAAKERLAADAPVTDSTMTLASWLQRWRETTLRASSRAASTKRLYSDLSRLHLEPAPFGAVQLSRLRANDIEAHLLRLQEESGLSASTTRSIYAVLRGALEIAVRDQLLARNPMTGVKRPAVARTEVTKLSAEEVVRLLDACRDTRHHTLLVLIAQTGMRRGEALALRWPDIDLNAGHLTVTHTLINVQGTLVLSEPKTARSRRQIPLSPGVLNLLMAHRARQRTERTGASEWHDTNDLVFTTTSGRPVDPRNVLRTVEKAASAVGLEHVGVHSLRHAFAGTLMEQGVHIKAVSDLLGHSTITVTADVYGHTSDTAARTAINGVASALGL